MSRRELIIFVIFALATVAILGIIKEFRTMKPVIPVPVRRELIPESDKKYIKVEQLKCLEVRKMFDKKDLSKMTEEEKIIVGFGTTTCFSSFLEVRMLKSRILVYSPKYHIHVGNKDNEIHITEYNVEYCEVGVGGATGKIKFVTINKTCDELDSLLEM